jgi:site-specific DNA-methyltransferase (adenine-specific)
MDEIIYSSRSEEYGTPRDLFWTLNSEFNFQLDAAASHQNAKCEKYLTKEENSLSYRWTETTWLNPPYGRLIDSFMTKAAFESHHRDVEVCCLVPARTDTEWFHASVWGRAAELRYIKGRLRFEGGEHSSTFPSVVIVYRPGDHACRNSTIDRQGRPLWTPQPSVLAA